MLTAFLAHRARWLDIVFLLACSAYILAGVGLTPFHADESTQITMSRDFAFQFLQGDLARLRYDPTLPLTSEIQLRLINGTVARYSVGLAWHLAGFQVDDLNGDWDWGGGWDYNVSAGHLPSDALLLVSRIPSAIFTAAGVWVLFVIGWFLGGRWAGCGAAAYYSLSPALLLNGRRAMMEGSLTFFGLLSVLAGIWFLKQVAPAEAAGRARLRPGLAVIFLGAASGLTAASKHTGVAVVAAVFAAAALGLLVMAAQRALAERAVMPALAGLASAGARLAAAGALALAVFFAATPAWWGADVPRAIADILVWRQELLTAQARDHNGYAEPITHAMGFARQVFLARPQYFEVRAWRDFPVISEQIARYEASPWSGVAIGGSPAGAGVVLLLLGAGVFALLRDPALALAVRLPVSVWAVVMGVVVFVSPVEWQRYYLPFYPVVGLLGAYGPFGAARWWRKIAAERAAKKAAAGRQRITGRM
jgi:hypothetical protein